MIFTLKKITILLEQLNSEDVTIREIKNQQKEIDNLLETIEEMNSTLNLPDTNDVCEIGERLFFLRAKLIDCDTYLNDLIGFTEKVIKQYDFSNC